MKFDTDIRSAFEVRPEMSEGEVLTRAREAWIATYRPWRWLARRVRAGRYDGYLRGIRTALRDMARPMGLIVAERDEATCALILRTTPGVTSENREVVAAAILTGVRMGRRG